MSEWKTQVGNDDDDKSKKKRVRDGFDDSEENSPDSKLARFDSVFSDGNSDGSGEEKRIQDDLLNFLDDADPNPAIQDLDSVIRSFEEEILVPERTPQVLTSDLGFLLEASDDELGLPPNFSAGDEQKIESFDLKTGGPEADDLDDMGLGLDGVMANYEARNFGADGVSDGNVNVSDDFITLGGSLVDSYEAGEIS